MAKKRYYQEYYAGMDQRRRRELEDAGMIKEDHSAVANLPQNVIYREYSRAGYSMDGTLDDTIRGVDNQIDADGRESKRHMNPKKY